MRDSNVPIFAKLLARREPALRIQGLALKDGVKNLGC
jgi:hypothetical protein